MYLKELERLARTLLRQRCDAAYIRHYLIETYQVSDAVVSEVFKTCNISEGGKQTLAQKTNEMMGGKKAEKPGDGKVNRNGYF